MWAYKSSIQESGHVFALDHHVEVNIHSDAFQCLRSRAKIHVYVNLEKCNKDEYFGLIV